MGKYKIITKNSISTLVFEAGVFLLPFENFFFAPSSGWASLSPILFFVYVLLNIDGVIKKVKDNVLKVLLIILGGSLLTGVAYLIVGARFDNFMSTLISLGLGVVSLLAFIIYYERQQSLKKIVKIILIAYSIAIVFGIIEWVTIKFDIGWLRGFFDWIFKRNYLIHNRVQFFFTEPSFIGMHVFGVLLPMYLVSKEKKLIWLIVVMSVLGIIFSSSMRFIIDVVAIGGLFGIAYLARKKKFWLIIVVVLALFGSLFTIYSTNDRFRTIVDNGVYADGSYASRFFRIEASLYGYANDFPQVLVGYGMGNSLIPIRSGHAQAAEHYKSRYIREVNQLADPDYNDESASYCLYTRIISDFGLIAFMLFMWFLIRITRDSGFQYKWEYLVAILYLYIQFESYAFFALWLYVAIMYFTSKKRKKQ